QQRASEGRTNEIDAMVLTMSNDATESGEACAQPLSAALVQGEGEPVLSDIWLRPTASDLGSIVIVVIVAGAQATGLRIHRNLSGFAVQQTCDLHVSAGARDHDIGPSVGLKFCFDLFCRYRTIARDEHRF